MPIRWMTTHTASTIALIRCQYQSWACVRARDSSAADGEAAIAMVRDGSYDLVLLDLMLPKANGLAVSEAIQALPVKPKVIVLSAISRYFADRFPEDTLVLQKPFDINRIEDVLRTLADD